MARHGKPPYRDHMSVARHEAWRTFGRKYWWWLTLAPITLRAAAVVLTVALTGYGLWLLPKPVLAGVLVAVLAGLIGLVAWSQTSQAAMRRRLGLGSSRRLVSTALVGLALLALTVAAGWAHGWIW